MKKRTFLLAAILALTLFPLAGRRAGFKNQAMAEELPVKSKSAYLMDADSKTELFSFEKDKRLPIASMCKIMTLVLCFDALNDGVFTLETQIPVSEHASSMGGSQVFLRSGATYKAGELLKSICVCSANDSCVAMAEFLAGSDDAFVSRMNDRAKELGANDTLFSNCTGLPKPLQYSTAHDVALMLNELLSHEEYYSYCSVWNDKFYHPDDTFTDITNTNKLIRQYQGMDGGKTGYTSEAGFCLASTAKRNTLRVISVVIGAKNPTERSEDTRKLLDYAFANYTNKIVVDDTHPLNEKVAVRGGKEESVAVVGEKNLGVLSKKGDSSAKIEIKLLPALVVKAPVQKGDVVGEIVVFKDGVEVAKTPALAFENVEKANLFFLFSRLAKGWNE